MNPVATRTGQPTGELDSRRLVVLILVGHYLPGYKGGGPIKSVSAMVDSLGDEFEFKVVTSDRDLGDEKPYQQVPRNQWTRVGKADVFYLTRGPLGILRILRILRSGRYDVVYVNSFFARLFSVCPVALWRLGLVPAPLLLAPRGEFSLGALEIKPLRKAAFIAGARRLGIYRGVAWHVSTPLEGDDVARAFGSEATRLMGGPLSRAQVKQKSRVREWVASDLGVPLRRHVSGTPNRYSANAAPPKVPGVLHLVFVSRVSRKKNLGFALDCLRGVRGRVVLDIYGPLEDVRYWRECELLVKRLPETVSVINHGSVPPTMVGQAFRDAHLFFLPTRGENFGHVILEALIEGCPALISDQTPWRGLAEANAGWVLPLADPAAFREALQHCIDLDGAGHKALVAGAQAYAEEVVRQGRGAEEHRAMFLAVAQGNP